MPDPDLHPVPKPEPLRGQVIFGAPPPDGAQDQNPALVLLELISYIMDRLVEVPGTKVRMGLNTALLLLPVFGDVLSSAVSLGILAIGLSLVRVPRIIAVRMMFNSVLDASIGWIPVVGDLFNLWFKADTRNVRLLQEYAGRSDADQPSTLKHWLFMIGMGLLLLLLLALLGLGVYEMISLIVWACQAPPPPPAQPTP